MFSAAVRGLCSRHLRRIVVRPPPVIGRSVHLTAYLTADKASLSKLRKRTGYPFINCRKALDRFENDVDKAEEWLRAEAQKEGWAKATKLQHRAMSNGLIGLIVEGDAASIVELNCETDFVARNKKFHALVQQVADACLRGGSTSNSDTRNIVAFDKSRIASLPCDGAETVSDAIALVIGNIGENMAPRRGVVMRAADGFELASYVHSAGPESASSGACQLGKYCAVVSYRRTASPPDGARFKTEELARQLCQHIVGMNPDRVGSPDDDDEPDSNKDDEKRLLFQEFLMDESITVKEFLEQNSLEISDFVKFQCGEQLPGDDLE
ncbi:elongation factor Ts, mitochondrial-like [Tubulanus polymorphus]|uniref:elongation factor Ts, mitochondrial-like n=1 Tax=Tubulanus polymorphus TaxID=672921 RepID=UPI003DA5FFA9